MPLVWLVLLCFAIPLGFKTEFNPNFIDLQAPNLQSVQLIKRIQTWSAVVLSKDLNVLRQARGALAGASSVAGTDSLLNAEDNYQTLHAVAEDLKVNWAAPIRCLRSDLPQFADRATSLAAVLVAGNYCIPGRPHGCGRIAKVRQKSARLRAGSQGDAIGRPACPNGRLNSSKS